MTGTWATFHLAFSTQLELANNEAGIQFSADWIWMHVASTPDWITVKCLLSAQNTHTVCCVAISVYRKESSLNSQLLNRRMVASFFLCHYIHYIYFVLWTMDEGWAVWFRNISIFDYHGVYFPLIIFYVPTSTTRLRATQVPFHDVEYVRIFTIVTRDERGHIQINIDKWRLTILKRKRRNRHLGGTLHHICHARIFCIH